MKVALNESTLDAGDIESAVDVLRSGHFTMGRLCADFETAFSKKLGVKHSLFVNSGSSANLLAFSALQYPLTEVPAHRKPYREGMEVIVPALTWSTSIWPIVQCGLKPVLVDSDPETLQMNFDQVRAAVNENTLGICAVHILGNAVDMEPLKKLADEKKLWIIEDTCESLGAKTRGKFAGTVGDFGSYSFYFSHHITTIEGGMVVTNDDALAENLRTLRSHGWVRHLQNPQPYIDAAPGLDTRFLFVNVGYNLRPTEINAALGLRQLDKLEGFNRRRNEISARWREGLASLESSGTLRFPRAGQGSEPQWFGFPALCRDSKTRDLFRARLEAAGIETRPIICGNLARHPAMKRLNYGVAGRLNGADTAMDCGLYWGLHPSMSDEQIDYVLQKVRGFFS